MTDGTREVAVILPAHNASGTIDASLAAIASQSVRPREVILVDDASTDDTTRLAGRWATMLPLRCVSSTSSRGAGTTRHVGVQQSTAPLIAFKDADDSWFPDHLERCLALREQMGGVVAGRGVWWHPGRGIDPPFVGPGTAVPHEHQLAWLVRQHTFGAHAVLSRSDYERVGGFDPLMEGVEDWDLWIRLSLLGVPLSRTATATGLYRQHAGSTSQRVEYVAGAGLRMLDRLEHDLLSDAQRTELADALRESRARLMLRIAYARLDDGDRAGARRAAVRSLTGPRDVVLRAAAVATLPGASGRLRRRRSP